MNKADVEKAVKQAEQYADEDKKTKEKIEVRNEADSVVYNIENMLKESGDKISTEEKETIEKAAAAVKDALKTDDVEKIKSTKDDLLKASHKLAEHMYKAAAEKQAQEKAAAGGNGQPAGEAPQEPGKGGDNVVDAEIVDEEKK